MTPGIHSLPAEQYRSAAGLSKSDLDEIQPPKTPAHFKAFKDGLRPRNETDAMRIGSITHRAILEPETMEGAFAIRPDGMKFTTKEGKAWKEEQTLPIIDSSVAGNIQAMVAAVWANPMAKRLLSGGIFEQSLFAEDTDGVLRKARLDALTKGNVIPDVKTCDSAAMDDLEKSINDYGYHRQGAYYIDICNLLGIDKAKFVLICVEKSAPFLTKCWQLSDDIIEAGRIENNCALQIYRNCIESGKWPGYGHEIEEINLPEWKMRQIAAVNKG